jgi:hypothetical protein
MVMDMLDISQPEKFIDYNTASVRAAEAENESIMQGVGELNDPQDYEDQVLHWQIHVKQMREWSFKNQTPVEIQERMKAHMMATELLMVKRARENPMYLERCSVLPGWPIYFDQADVMPPMPPEPPLPPEAMPPAEGMMPEEQMVVAEQVPGEIAQQEAMNQVNEEPVGAIEPSTAI